MELCSVAGDAAQVQLSRRTVDGQSNIETHENMIGQLWVRTCAAPCSGSDVSKSVHQRMTLMPAQQTMTTRPTLCSLQGDELPEDLTCASQDGQFICEIPPSTSSGDKVILSMMTPLLRPSTVAIHFTPEMARPRIDSVTCSAGTCTDFITGTNEITLEVTHKVEGMSAVRLAHLAAHKHLL